MEFVLSTISRETVLKMLRMEEKLKYSFEVQKQYSELYENQLQNTDLDIYLQTRVLAEHGFATTQSSLEEYWKIPSTYWHDSEVKNAVFYMRLNIFQFSTCSIGDTYRNSTIYHLNDSTKIKLSDLQLHNRPLILLCGSIT
jgi:hypothetical protein